MITKQDIVNELLANDFTLDGVTDYKRISEFVREHFKLALTNKAVWAVVNALKTETLAELDFD